MDVIEKHFDGIVGEYDFWKRKNWYYYAAVKRIYKRLILEHSRVLEVGCGTGEILASLNPTVGVGIDVSGGMVKRAREKYTGAKNLLFQHSDIIGFQTTESFDYIFLADVIEHLLDAPASIRAIARLMRPDTKLVVSMANPLWEPVLLFAEKLHMKMPEGPHTRISGKALVGICRDAGMTLVKRDFALLFPKYIPFFSNIVNAVGEHIPFVRRLGVITVFVFVPSPKR